MARRRNPLKLSTTVHLRDVDTGRPVEVEIKEFEWGEDEIVLTFGDGRVTSYRLTVTKAEAKRLANRLHDIALGVN